MTLLENTAEILEPFAGLWAGVEVAQADAQKFQYQAQIEALKAQMSAPEYEAQDVREVLYTAGPGGLSFGSVSPVWWVLGGLAVVVLLKKV